mgnify:FL=1
MSNIHQSNQDLDKNGIETENSNLGSRHRIGRIMLTFFQASTLVGIIALTALLLTIVNSNIGYAAIEYTVDPDDLAVEGVPLEELPDSEHILNLEEKVTAGMFRQLNRELPLSERSRDVLYGYVLDLVVAPRVAQMYTLFDSLF